MAHQLIWGTVLQIPGVEEERIPLDLRLEHLNRQVTDYMHHLVRLGGYLKEKAMDHGTGSIEMVLTSFGELLMILFDLDGHQEELVYQLVMLSLRY